MIDGIGTAAGILIGSGIGFYVSKMIHKMAAPRVSENDVIALEQKLAVISETFSRVEKELTHEKIRVGEKEINLMDAARKISSLEAELRAKSETFDKIAQNQKESFEKAKDQSKIEFENLANKILELKSEKFSETATLGLKNLLEPLKERLTTFEKKVDDSYSTEAKERHVLKSEIERLIGLNEKMSKDATALTQALKGDSKVQGDWGEVILERILESSGLREDSEYRKQSSYENDGDRLRPDIIIDLPDSKHIIVDSKVSITAYERYSRAETDEGREQALKAHIDSISKHIDELADKRYDQLFGISSPDFVFMFIPIEPAYVLAMQKDPELGMRAWKKNVAIVTPSTLFTSLKTVASIWKVEKQNKNAEKIADEAGKLYDKFAGLVVDLESIEKALSTSQKVYGEAMRKLKDGPGNVFRKLEELKSLGANTKKQLSVDATD